MMTGPTRTTGALVTTGTTTEPPRSLTGAAPVTGAPDPQAQPGWRPFARLRGVRTRILASYVGLLALATVASVLVARQVLVGQLDGRIDAELRQEAEELGNLADDGIDPLTGRPFGLQVDRIFEVHLQRNIPSRNEALLTFVDGRPYLRSVSVVDYRLDQDAELVELWGTVQDSARGRVDTPAGEVEYLAVPLRSDGEVLGVFVAAIFRERALALYTTALVAVGGVGLAMLLVGSTLAWRLADSVLRPVRSVTRTARSINESDLRQRIDVDGQDEVAELATTFNAMLDRLEASFATQRRFLDDAGHELRTPITIARGHLELLGDDDPQERAETVALVLDELERMGRMVDDLLLLAKVEEPSFLELGLVDVDVLTDELRAKTQALGDRSWLLERRAEGVVLADRQRLTQAVVQLAQNAVQHTGPGDEIALGSSLEQGELRLWVRDTGPGLAPEEHERVFERFARARGNRHREGAGLGLSIVRAIAEAHGGCVLLESRPGAGALFTLVLPAAAPDTDEDEP
jgi:signal transduction histidine kinase